MEIELKNQKPWKKWLSAGSLILLVSYAAYAVTGTPTLEVSLSELQFETVKQGNLDIYANTYGELASAKERLLTAPALGKVSEILVRPGAKVSPDTVILKLSNPRLEQEANQTRGELAQLKAQREAFKYEQQSERLEYQGQIADIEADIERAELDLSVNQELSVLGVASKLDLEKAKLTVKQQKKRLVFEQQKYQQFLEMQSFQMTQSNITVEQQQSQVALLEQQLKDMHVTAGISGSLQTLEVELGQSVQLGHSLAKVGSDNELIARIRLPQGQADQIDLNAAVIVDTQKGLISGHISRIESLVTNGSVLAEVILDDDLTSNSRPALPISAQVFVKHQQASVFMSQVPGIRPRSSQQVFVNSNNGRLEKRNITLGDLSQDKLVIVDGLVEGEKVVSSDTSQYNNFQHLSIVQ